MGSPPSPLPFLVPRGNGKTPLHYAAQLRPKGAELCRALLEASAEAERRSGEFNPCAWAVFAHNSVLLQVILAFFLFCFSFLLICGGVLKMSFGEPGKTHQSELVAECNLQLGFRVFRSANEGSKLFGNSYHSRAFCPMAGEVFHVPVDQWIPSKFPVFGGFLAKHGPQKGHHVCSTRVPGQLGLAWQVGTNQSVSSC